MSGITIFKNARIIDPSRHVDEIGTIVIKDGVIAEAGASALNQGAPEGATVKDCTGLIATPGLVDARVHVGEPGAEHRETIASAARAAAAGADGPRSRPPARRRNAGAGRPWRRRPRR